MQDEFQFVAMSMEGQGIQSGEQAFAHATTYLLVSSKLELQFII